MSLKAIKPIPQLLREAKSIPKKKTNIDLAVCTSAGIILDVKITSDIEEALKNREHVPIYFLAGIKILNYMVAPSYQSELRSRYGDLKSEDMINQLINYLESKKGRPVVQREAQEANALLLE